MEDGEKIVALTFLSPAPTTVTVSVEERGSGIVGHACAFVVPP